MELSIDDCLAGFEDELYRSDDDDDKKKDKVVVIYRSLTRNNSIRCIQNN
jgi:hypothetical protein